MSTSRVRSPWITPLVSTAVVGAGACYPLSAYYVHPLALPVGAIGAVAASVGVLRPAVGVGIALFAVVAVPAAGGARPSFPVVGLVGLLLLMSAVLEAGETRSRTRVAGGLSLAVAVYVLVDLLVAAQASDPGAALYFLRSPLTGAAVFFLVARNVRTFHDVAWFLRGASGATLFATAMAMLEVFGGVSQQGFFTDSGALVYRVSGGFGHPNQLAGLLVILVPLAIYATITDRRWRAVHAVAALGGFAAIYYTFSRGALVGIAIAIMVMLGRRTIYLAPIGLLLAVLLMPGALTERFETSTIQGSEFPTRVDIWNTAAAIWQDAPVTGVGLGGFPRAYAEARVPGKSFLPGTLFQPAPHAHSLPLQVLAEKGIVGLVALVVLLAGATRHAVRIARGRSGQDRLLGRTALAALVGFMIDNVLDYTLWEATGVILFGIIGLVAASVHDEQPPLVHT